MNFPFDWGEKNPASTFTSCIPLTGGLLVIMKCNKDNKEKIDFSVIKGHFLSYHVLMCWYICSYDKSCKIATISKKQSKINNMLRHYNAENQQNIPCEGCLQDRISFLLAVAFEELCPLNRICNLVKLRLGRYYPVVSVAMSCFPMLSYSVWVAFLTAGL